MDTNNRLNIQKYDLTVGQQALWFIHSLNGLAKSAYNEHLVFSLSGNLSISALKESFIELIKNNEILRVNFESDANGNLIQVLNNEVDFNFCFIKNIQFKLAEYIINELTKPFDLQKAPLMRVLLIEVSERNYILLIIVHHIIIDGTSLAIVINELSNIYNKIIIGNNILNCNPKGTFFDHINKEQQHFLSQNYQDKLTNLTQSLKSVATLNFLTTPNKQVGVDKFAGDRFYFQLDSKLYNRVRDFCKLYSVTSFHFFLTVYYILLNKYTRSNDIVVGVPFANRINDLECHIVGHFINTLPIRLDIDPNKNIIDLMLKVRTLVLSAFGKQEVPLEHIMSRMNLGESRDEHKFSIQTILVWTKNVFNSKPNFKDVTSNFMQEYFPKTSKFDISLFMSEEDTNEIKAYFEYRTNLFDKGSVANITNIFLTLIESILDNHFEPILSINMLNKAEENRIKNHISSVKLNQVVDTSLGKLFSKTAASYGMKEALSVGHKKYNYHDLEIRSNQWAVFIHTKYEQIYGRKMPKNSLIGLCIDRNEDMIFGMLGILKAGAAYVPIDPKYPKDRIDYIISDSNVALLLTTHKHKDLKLQIDPRQVIYMDDTQLFSSTIEMKSYKIDADSVAYVLYTSGSTGKPKGVAVTHKNIICLFESLKKEFEIDSNDVWSLFHTFCFDISVWEIWGAFLFGGMLVIIPYDVSREPKAFYNLLKIENVTVLTQTPSAFQMLLNEDLKHEGKLDKLRYISFVGESLKISILDPWVKKYGFSSPMLANLYGITETTVYTNCKFINQIDFDKGRDNIGWPLENYSMVIMDENQKWCPMGIVGEIYIGGSGLAKGYLNQEQLTREKFILDPYASILGMDKKTRLYRTGDLGRWVSDGSVEYLGRKDFQIKLRGFRIELGEIESALGSYSGISHIAVLLKGNGEEAYLVAYYTLMPNIKIEKSKLIYHLSSFLPNYMIPNRFIELKSFPMTVNGKIDRNMLNQYDDRNIFEDAIIPLSSEIEYEIGNIWAELLQININSIGATSNFFAIGGTSLLVVKMLRMVGKKLNKDLTIAKFMGMPTIRSLAVQETSYNKQDYIKHLEKDIVLEENIQPLSINNPDMFHPKAIFLTGATGFLGSHLLNELLKSTDAQIFCLVRAESKLQGLEKILTKLNKYKLTFDNYSKRIIPVLGDLSKLNLGMDTKDFSDIIKYVDAIYHVGALVHHLFDYASLYKTNVQSVKEIIKIAILRKNKAIHFISTFNVNYISPLEKLSVLEENSHETHLNFNGYLSSKWAAEQLLQEASRRRIIAHVYRPGNIIAGESGIYEPDQNHALLRLKGILQLGKVYIDKRDILEMMPVDILAKSLIEISSDPDKFAYNLHNQNKISWYDYIKYMQDFGYKIEFLQNNDDWNCVLNELDESNALYKLSFLYKTNNNVLSDNKNRFEEPKPDYVIKTPSYYNMVGRQINSLINIGFLSIP